MKRVLGLLSNCYAYKKNECVETWHKHTMDVVECIKSRWETEAFIRKSSRMLGLGSKIVNDFLLLAGFLHDIAKTDVEYQKRCVDECTAFPKHWYASAMIALRLGLDVGILGDGYEDRIVKVFSGIKQSYDIGDAYTLLVFIPVLFHNYAHLSEEALFDFHKYLGTYIKGVYTAVDECCRQITKAIDEMTKIVKTDIAKILLSKLHNYIGSTGVLGSALLGENALRISALGYGRIESARAKYIAEAATGLLNMCDGRVAYRNRRCATDE